MNWPRPRTPRSPQLREQIKQAQAANQKVDDRDYSEAQTRDRFIDVLLAEAGWPLSEERDREFKVTGMPTKDGIGFVDYVLWGADGLPLAIVEAKRTTKSPQLGQQQAKLYADCLEAMTGRRPVMFYTNGYEHWIWDDAAGYPPREVQGFYTRNELELLIHRRHARKSLTDTVIDSAIVERHYQHHAIRAIDDAFTAKQREALLVMATGAGKTRTVIALVKQMMEAGWVKTVLFLADRTALVTQAANAFKAHLPDATTVNLVTEKVSDGRVYVCTYPTMMNLINDTDSGTRTFGPGYFDLVVIDEAHRSVYQKYRRDLLLVRLAAGRVDRHPEGRGRPQHLPTVPSRRRCAHRRLQPRRRRQRRLPGACGGRVRRDEVPAPGHPVRRPVRGGEGRVGCAGMGRGRPTRLGVLGRDQPIPVQRGHRRSGAGHADGQGAQGLRR